MLFFVTFAALDGKLVITSVANLPLISIKIVYIVGQFVLSVFQTRNNKLNENL